MLGGGGVVIVSCKFNTEFLFLLFVGLAIFNVKQSFRQAGNLIPIVTLYKYYKQLYHSFHDGISLVILCKNNTAGSIL